MRFPNLVDGSRHCSWPCVSSKFHSTQAFMCFSPRHSVGEVLFHCVLASSLLKSEEEPLQISGILSLGMSLLSMLWPRNSSCLPPLISQLHLFNSGSHRVLTLRSYLHALWSETHSRPLAGAVIGLTLFISHFSWIIVLCCLMSSILDTVVSHVMSHL